MGPGRAPQVFGFVLEDNLLPYRQMVLEHGQAAMTVPEGTVLSSGGQPSSRVYFLLDGLVKISIINIHGYERILGYHKKNTICAMDALRREENVIVTVTAVTRVRAVGLSLEDLTDLFGRDPGFAAATVLYYSDVLKLMCYDAESRSSNDVRSRLANFLLLYMQSADYRELGYIPLSQAELASAVGASRIQTARVCGALKREGVVRVEKRRLYVLCQDSLRQSASYQGFI